MTYWLLPTGQVSMKVTVLAEPENLGCLPFTQTIQVEILCINMNYKIGRDGRMTRNKVDQDIKSWTD